MTTSTAELELPSAEELNQGATGQAVNEEATAAIEAGDEAAAPTEPENAAQGEVAAAPAVSAEPAPEAAPARPPAKTAPPESKAADRLDEIKRARREVAARKAEYFEAKEVAKEAKKDWESARNRLEKIIDGERPAPILDAIEAAGESKPKAAATEKKARRKANKAEGASDRASTASGEGEITQLAKTPDAWRSVPIEQLGLPPKLAEKLKEAAVDTIGQLENLRASRAHGDGLQSLKGIGKSKADQIEDAVISWLSRNRDKAALAEAGAK